MLMNQLCSFQIGMNEYLTFWESTIVVNMHFYNNGHAYISHEIIDLELWCPNSCKSVREIHRLSQAQVCVQRVKNVRTCGRFRG